MIRSAVSALRRTPVASLRRATTPGQLVRHPLPAPSASSSSLSRGLHGVAAGSGLLRAHTVPLLPGISPAAASMAAAARRLNTAAGGSFEETKSALMQSILDQEHKKAAFAAAGDKEESISQKVDREMAEKKEVLARKAGKKAKMEEMMALISRQVAAGEAPDREALLLVRSARADIEIEQLKEKVKRINLTVKGMTIAFLVYILYRAVKVNKVDGDIAITKPSHDQ